MKSKDKDQRNIKRVRETSRKIDSVDEHRDILKPFIREGEEIFKINNRAITLSARCGTRNRVQLFLNLSLLLIIGNNG
jgi:hypothetical protein